VRLSAQINLVPNPGFEIFSPCPNSLSTPGFDKVAYASSWSSYGDTPDYFNSCANASSNAGVPDNFWGFQQVDTGNAYCGLFAYMTGNFREYMGCQLLSPLSVGQKYYVSFKVNRADKPIITMTCNKLGTRFSTIPYSETNPVHGNNFAHVCSSSIVADTANWVVISGSFIADSAYSYLILGNFFDDNNTDTASIGSAPYRAYYYIDDVYVSTDSLNSVESNIGNNVLNIFPNPVIDNLTIEFEKKTGSNSVLLTIYNVLGEKVEEEKILFEEGKYIVNRNGLECGIYLLRIESDDVSYSRKIVFQ
jgi:hypothetical protein